MFKSINLTQMLAAVVLSVLCPGLWVQAQMTKDDVTYSPNSWPNRWSSAIRTQNQGKYPTRRNDQAPLVDLEEAVSGQDLFYVPMHDPRYGQEDSAKYWDKKSRKSHFSRNNNGYYRDAAYAYQPWFSHNGGGYPSGNYASYSPYGGYGGYAPGMMDIDPVLGMPGLGIPIMPGVPGIYPIGMSPFVPMGYGYPGMYGYPMAGYPGGFMSNWNPPFGAW